MGYSTVDPGAVEPTPDRPCEQRRLSEAAEMDRMVINRYRAEPGEQIPLAYHYHDRQEEAFYVLSGTLHVETPDSEYAVEAEGLFAVDPGSPQRAFNPADADGAVEVVAIGAPPAGDDGHAYGADG